MKRFLTYLIGTAAMVSPVAPTGCETVRIGLSYQDDRGTSYTVTRTRSAEHRPNWDILVTADGKEMKLPKGAR